MSQPICGRSWSAIVEHDSTSFDMVYEHAILSLATLQANEYLTELESRQEEIPPDMRPTVEDPDEVIHMVVENERPAWWPQVLDRLNIKITIRPDGSTPEVLSPHPLDPNNADLGKAHFMNLLKNRLESAGSPFEGNIQIQLYRIRGKTYLGGWRGNIYVGEKLKKKRGGQQDSEKDEMFELMLEEWKRSQDAQHRMFANASNVIHASGAAINAMRGANAPPPWMQEGGEEMPMWLALAKGAMEMVMQANTGQPQQVAQAGMQMMQHPVQNPGALGAYNQGQLPQHQPPQLPGPTAQDQLGYGQYQQQGEYDGYYAAEDDLIDDDDFDDDFYEEDEEYDDEDEDEEDEEYDEEDEEEDEYEEPPPRRRRNRVRGRSGNPLDGMNPSELQAALDDYIDNNPDKRDQIKQLGMGLAKKLL